jgi:hypothetical protein
MIRALNRAFSGTTVVGTWFVLLAIWGCSSGLPSTQTAARKPYDWEAKLLHPEFSSIRFSSDSAAVFLRLDRAELLYLRETPAAPFTAKVEIHLGPLQWEIRDTLEDAMPQALDAIWRVAVRDVDSTVARGDGVDVAYLVRDAFRNSQVTGRWELAPATQTLNRFDANGWAVNGSDLTVGDTLYLQGPGGLMWTWSQVRPEPSLPSPPFSAFSDPFADLEATLVDTLIADAAGRFAFVVPDGTSILRSTALGFELVVHGRRKDFPFVRSVPYLIETTRYITSRSEYERMSTSMTRRVRWTGFGLTAGTTKTAART